MLLFLLLFVFLFALDITSKQSWACRTYLRDHHMAIKRAFTTSGLGTIDVRSDLCNDGSPERDIGDEMAIHL